MISFKLSTLLAAATFSLGAYASAPSQDQTLKSILPATPKLPGDAKGTYTSANGAKIWHAEFGTKGRTKLPVLLLHNGLGSSDYWGGVVELLMKKHYVIVMDTRGHGRSPSINEDDFKPFTFKQYAQDAAKVLWSLGIRKAAWVGWSEGANTVLEALLDPKLFPMVDRAFTTGAWHNILANNVTYMTSQTYTDFSRRASAEYKAFQPEGNLKAFLTKSTILKSTLPKWTESDLNGITLKSKLTLSWGEHEEAVHFSEMDHLPKLIKRSKKVIMPGVSHFAPLQNPTQFAAALETFLA
ncbi:hypothetical protein RSAG8_07310, partial [Rhizoctonia solani AG-8 WAC10335]